MQDTSQRSRAAAAERPPRVSRRDRRLLEQLLDEVPPRAPLRARAPRLRTTDDQRRTAFSGYLLRNWLDRTLLIAETVLLLVLLAAAAYWLTDTYARDWIYQWRRQQLATVEPTALNVPTTMPLFDDAPAASLPYINPDERDATPEYLVEQPQQRRPVAGDPRPQRITIPVIGLDSGIDEVFAVDGVWQVAEYAAGYHHGTALPGETGNTVIAGHAGLRGAVFKDLPRLQAGDEVIVEAGDWIYTYQVRELREVWPTQIEVMDPTPTAVLTLITCTNWDTQRLIVVADLVASRPRS